MVKKHPLRYYESCTACQPTLVLLEQGNQGRPCPAAVALAVALAVTLAVAVAAALAVAVALSAHMYVTDSAPTQPCGRRLVCLQQQQQQLTAVTSAAGLPPGAAGVTAPYSCWFKP
jgi:hypothetical protein